MLSELAAPQRKPAIGASTCAQSHATCRAAADALLMFGATAASCTTCAVPAQMWNQGHARSRRRCGSDGDRTSASSRCATRQSRSKRTAKLPRHLSPAARRGCLSASSWAAPRLRNQRERRGNHAARATHGATGRVLSVQQPRASRMMRAVERHVRRSLPGRVGCALGGVCMCIVRFASIAAWARMHTTPCACVRCARMRACAHHSHLRSSSSSTRPIFAPSRAISARASNIAA
jgi:hypothetical protein